MGTPIDYDGPLTETVFQVAQLMAGAAITAA
jgi:hypothetical protein